MPALRTSRRRVCSLAAIAMVVAIAAAGCGTNDGVRTPTASVGSPPPTPAASVTSRVATAEHATGAGTATPGVVSGDESLTYYKRIDSVIARAASGIETATADGITSNDVVKAYEAFESDLRSLTPPAAVAAPHDALVDAVRAFADFARKFSDELTPDATAEANVAPALGRFASACRTLQSIANAVDDTINLRCDE